MKFTVDVEEFWIEEDELTDALKRDVKRDVVNQISTDIKDKVEQEIALKVKEAIDNKINLIIDSTLTDLMATGVISRNNQEITIEAYVKDLFQKNTGWNQPARQIDDIAKKFGQELKAQYNNIFATKIVQNLKEQGMLKDEVAQILLEDK